MDAIEEKNVQEDILKRRENLFNGVKAALKTIPVSVEESENDVTVHFSDLLICGASVKEEGYRIFNASPEWADTTTYLCEKSEDGAWCYYLDSIDECIGEMQRLVMFEAHKGIKPQEYNVNYTSEFSQLVTDEDFEIAYKHFIEQADKNAITGRGQGSKVPYGFNYKPIYHGAEFKQQFGQGNASETPYMNWHVVSIYYIPKSKEIILGIEAMKDRIDLIKRITIKKLGSYIIGNKKNPTVVYFKTTKESINYQKLYDNFIQLCEEVIAKDPKFKG